MLNPEEYVIQDIVPCRENDMCYYTFGTNKFDFTDMSRLWRASVKASTNQFYPIGKMHGHVIENHTLHVFCKRKDLPVVTGGNDLIFGSLSTHSIDKNGGWYVTANGLVVLLDKKSEPSHNHPECHKPSRKVNHGLDLMEAVWWHTNGEVYFKNDTERKLCQPLLRIVAKLQNFHENPPTGFVFKHGFPKFEKPEDGADYCTKYVVSGDARIILISTNPVVQIAKATGNFAARSANYWLAQPTMIMGKAVISSLRFIFASAVIGSIVGSISYPETAKKVASSMIPKVEIKIEKPSILK